jgi:glycosyltransferase involved in cell wall biosynthesis
MNSTTMNNTAVPQIRPITEEGHRPVWSVMIPVYNRVKYLRQALESVLSQGYSQDEMQIEVVDDCSENNEAEAIVNEMGCDRISFYRQCQRGGFVSNWNTCIGRARGQLVHILHDDDFVATGYYEEINALRNNDPDLGLYATRSFIIDEESAVTGVTSRLTDLESPERSAKPFFYENPIRFPGVTVQRRSYEKLGGFRPDLGFVADWEMWARISDSHGALISSRALTFYRFYTGNATWEYIRAADNGRYTMRLSEVFAGRYSGFSVPTARNRTAANAWHHYTEFKCAGDELAANANWQLWAELTPLRQRAARRIKQAVMPAARRLASSIRRRVVRSSIFG